jgi:hypothetical protein
VTVSDEKVVAYVDRELDAASCAEIESAAARDPQLAERIERQRALRTAVHAAFEPVLEEPMPKRLLDLASGTQPAHAIARQTWGWFQWGAVAASLALGIAIGATVLREPAPGGDFVAQQGRLVAGGELAKALSQQLANDQAADAPIRIGLTFVSRDGKYCRSFTHKQTGQAGLACNESGEWQLEVVAMRASESGEYRMAGGPLPAPVLRAVEERMQGATLDASAERLAKERGWRR